MNRTARTDSQTGFSGFEDRQSQKPSLLRFRKGRRPGDIVSGSLLRIESEQYALALLEGEELLALLPENGPRPTVGEQVFFRIEALKPELRLRMLPGNAPEAGLARLFPALPLSREALFYLAARDKVDYFWQATLLRAGEAPCCVKERKELFIREAAADPSAFRTATEALIRADSLRRSAEEAGLVFFRHMPWLSTELRAVELSIWQQGKESTILAGGTMPSGSRFLLRARQEDGLLYYQMEAADPPSVLAGRLYLEGKKTALSCPASGEKVFLPSIPEATVDLVGLILAAAARTETSCLPGFSRKL